MSSSVRSLNSKTATYLSPSSVGEYISNEKKKAEASKDRYYTRMNAIRNKATQNILKGRSNSY